MMSLLAKPAVKYGVLALAVLALIAGVAWYIRDTREDGKKAGAAEVTTKVQTETIKQGEKAREEKGKADEKVRSQPIDAVIDGLR